jgi:hypothetical protein
MSSTCFGRHSIHCQEHDCSFYSHRFLVFSVFIPSDLYWCWATLSLYHGQFESETDRDTCWANKLFKNIWNCTFIWTRIKTFVTKMYGTTNIKLIRNCELPEDGAVLAPKHVGVATITFEIYLLINSFCWLWSILTIKMHGPSYKKKRSIVSCMDVLCSFFFISCCCPM